MRRHREQEHVNNERWMVSYADFITLLFAFFVVMYSISSVNEGKYKVLSESLDGIFNASQRSLMPIQFGEKETPKPLQTVEPDIQPIEAPKPDSGDKAQDKLVPTDLNQMSERLGTTLSNLMLDGLVTMNENENWIELSLRNSLLFSSGDAVPNAEAFPLVEDIARVLRDYPNAILVEGFTDDIPITTPVYPSNWELSGARAAAIVRMLIDNGVDAKRLAAVGYGENQPIARNDTSEGRQRNRRVVLLIAKDSNVRLTMRPR